MMLAIAQARKAHEGRGARIAKKQRGRNEEAITHRKSDRKQCVEGKFAKRDITAVLDVNNFGHFPLFSRQIVFLQQDNFTFTQNEVVSESGTV